MGGEEVVSVHRVPSHIYSMLYSTRVLCCTMPNDDDDIVLIPPGGYPFTLYALRLPVVYTRCALARRGSFENMKMLLCI